MKTRFVASGDSFTTRRIPADYPGGSELRAFIGSHDVAFNNLEMTYHDHEGTPAAFSGGTWAMADPVILSDLQAYGFNIYNTANNHSSDYGPDGLMATVRHLKERDMVFSGTGENLYAASAPCYFDAPGCRTALIGFTSDLHDSDIAGPQGPVMKGRPGVNALRTVNTYHVTQAEFDTLAAIAAETGMNTMAEYGVKLGYAVPAREGVLNFNDMSFKLDDRSYMESRPNPKDMERAVTAIREARRQADYVMVSVHTHAGSPFDLLQPPQFLEDFAHSCIDAGADVILGHGPHELRGIEIYNGKPIFYSLGNFIFETETVAEQPAEAFLGKGFSADTGVGTYMSARSKDGTRGYGVMPSIWFTVLPSWEADENFNVKEIRLHPVTLGQNLPRSRKGLPRLVKDDSILTYLQGLCGRFGTKIEIQPDGTGLIRL